MKLYRLCITLLTALLAYDTQADFSHKRPTPPNHTKKNVTEHFQTSITPLEINTNGTRTIDQPGHYYITGDTDFDPVNGGESPIIQIKSSNVTLNLNGKKIHQATGHTGSNVVGIEIGFTSSEQMTNEQIANVVVHNGSIHDCSGAGIIVHQNCRNITLSQLSILDCAFGGVIVGYNPFDIPTTYPSIFDAQETIRFVDPATGSSNSTKDILIENVYVSGVTGYYNTTTDVFAHAIGIQLVDVLNFQILDTISNSSQYSAPNNTKQSNTDPGGYYNPNRSGYNGYGVQLIRCQNGHIQNSECSNTLGYSAYGFLFEQSHNITCINCFANHTTADADPIETSAQSTTFNFMHHRDLGRAAGFMLHDSSNNTFDNCSALYTKGTREAAGFWLRRYIIMTSTTSIPNSQQFDPTILQPQITANNTASNVDLGNILLVPAIPSMIPTKGAGYEVPTTALYIAHGGSNCNHVINSQARHTSSLYLAAHGFLSQGNNNNSFTHTLAQNSTSGIGASSYAATNSISDFDTDTGVWSLVEYDKYKNPHTDQIIQYASGISLECTRLPLSEWNNGLQLKTPSTMGNLVFLGVVVNTTPAYAIPCWSETCSTISDGSYSENYGSVVGTGAGILINGGYKSIIKKNWISCNHSSTLGVTPDICNTASGIGAQGGYGILDLARNSTSLIMENLAYANETIQPKTVSGLTNYIEGANYHATYTDTTLKVPVEKASIGDFSPFNILTPFSNFEWECATTNPSYTLEPRKRIESVPKIFTI